LLLTVAVMNVFKPQGVTRYGWRKLQERRHQALQRREPGMLSQPELASTALPPEFPTEI
jgi:hypothetical protein